MTPNVADSDASLNLVLLQAEFDNDAGLREGIKEGIVFMEVYSAQWGRAQCFRATIQKLYFQYMDVIKFHMACVDNCKTLSSEGFECIEPTFLFYKDGKRIKTVQGLDGPLIESTLAELKASVS